MTTTTQRAFAIAAFAFAIGLSGLRFCSADAESTSSYIAGRVDAAFDAVAEMPPVEPLRMVVSTKGDLQVPLRCIGKEAKIRTDCMSVPSARSFVTETRFGNTSILVRMDAVAVAGRARRAGR